jgi:hypothetical protein
VVAGSSDLDPASIGVATDEEDVSSAGSVEGSTVSVAVAVTVTLVVTVSVGTESGFWEQPTRLAASTTLVRAIKLMEEI